MNGFGTNYRELIMTTATIDECTTTSCAFNHNGCTAFAITIAGSANHAACGTFVELDARGGLPSASAQVGACQRAECLHNTDLMCTAEGIRVGAGADTADCLNYQAR